MSEYRLGRARFCEVALPVPVDSSFTYQLPKALQGEAQVGARVLAPFRGRKLTGLIVELHDIEPPYATRPIARLLDTEPVLDGVLLRLAGWIATYYCAPLGEVVKAMLPLSGEARREVRYAITPLGRDVSRQLTVAVTDTAANSILTLLDERGRTAQALQSRVPGASSALKQMLERGWVSAEQVHEDRDLTRARGPNLRVEFVRRPAPEMKLSKSAREVMAYLELHPGPHALDQIAKTVKRGSEATRSLARGTDLLRIFEETSALAAGLLPSFQGGAAADMNERARRELTDAQQAAFEAISARLRDGGFETFLLQGVTGSGKTEVYLRCIEETLALGKSALLLVPEIALTPAVAGQFFQRFGGQTAILHSAFSKRERSGQWRRIRDGQARVVVGTRSGVFAPVQQLGLLIIDEEHDGSYKQGETPRYHGRDVAIMRGREEGATVLLGSATPSLESRFNADAGKYRLLRLPDRIAERPLPSVEVIDMRTEFLETRQQSTFSRRLLEALTERLGRGEQSVLLLNRRGFSSFMVCRACGERLECANCSVTLTHHRRDHRMLCHYCSYAESVPGECPKCGSDHIQFLGAGSERVEDELHRLLPTARIARLDRDTASARGAFEFILQSFRNGDIDILVGTQMIAKGHDVPNVTLVGVVLADIGLSLPDFRAAERSFQLLTQAAGRAGRGDLPGQVLIQTLNPDHYAIQLAIGQDYDAFYARELDFRRWLRYPPFAAFASVLVRASRQEEALRLATELGRELMPPPAGLKVIGPAEATVLRVKNEFRYQMLLKAARRPLLREVVNRLRSYAAEHSWSATALTVDIDPVTLM